MNVSLTPELEKYVQDKVASGDYITASEVVREGLRLLKERDLVREHRIAELNRIVQVGLDQLDRGEYVSYDDDGLREFFDEVKRKGMERLGIPQQKVS